MKELEVKAASVEAAIEEALAQLNKTADEVEVEVLSKGGLLRKAAVKVTVKQTPQESAQQFIDGVLLRMQLDCTTSLQETEEAYVVNLTGSDNGTAIGYRGEVLDALQYLALLVGNRLGMNKRLIIDAEDYRRKRTETLQKLSMRLAKKVAKTGYSEELEPMNSFERRVIHTHLKDDAFVETKSMGEEPRRYIVIVPKKKAESDRYDWNAKNQFKRTGVSRTKSYGAKKKYF